MNKNLANLYYKIQCDCPESWQNHFQDPASSSIEGLLLLNNHTLFLLFSIIIFISWILLNNVFYFNEFQNKFSSKFTYSKTIEIFWTCLPIIIVGILIIPSLGLLYFTEQMFEPKLTLKIMGHQWFWNYETNDYSTCNRKNQSIKYTCYMLVFEGMPKSKLGYFRLLETNKRVLLPTNTHIRLLVSSADVLHSWTIPSFGIKIDACPGRLNQTGLFIKRSGIFFGQCSEICGINHGFMPIVIVSIPFKNFNVYVGKKFNFF